MSIAADDRRTCGYSPDPAAVGRISESTDAQLLVVGGHVGDHDAGGLVVRIIPADAVALPEGFYWFDHGDKQVFLVVPRGEDPQDQECVSVEEFTTSDHPLHAVLAWFDHLWPNAKVVNTPRFRLGDTVVARGTGEDTQIRRRSWRSGAWWYDVRLDGKSQTLAERHLDAPDVRDDPLRWLQDDAEDARRFAATLTRAKLSGSFTDTLFSFRATRTLFRPYQFRPVIKLLETGRLRLLVADEVGLGKTIEAGLLWTELEARRRADRVLVLCPSGLVEKWKREMEERFGFDLSELDRQGLEDYSDRLAKDRLPSRHHYICSVERLRAWSGLEHLATLDPEFDLVIVDEAHVFRNAGTKSNALGGLLSYWADALVFLSATPLNLRNQDLFNLLDLLVPGEFDDYQALEERLQPNALLQRLSASLFDPTVDNSDRRAWLEAIGHLTFGPAVQTRPEFSRLTQLVSQPTSPGPREIVEAKRLVRDLHALSSAVTRTRKVEVNEDKAVREAHRESVELSTLERQFYAAYYGWCRLRADVSDAPVGFAMQMPLRLASTCLQVAKHQVLTWSAETDRHVLADADNTSDLMTAGAKLPALPPPADLVRAAHQLGHVDTKLQRFLSVMQELRVQNKQALVFTFSKPTIRYLRRHLVEARARVAVLTGDVPKAERLEVMRDFREGAYDVVLANRVASEGLDFEFCSAVVNYDLPWNPMEVEQRIGRLDRIGQQEEKILIFNFITPGTVESDILQRVLERIGVFERSIGELEPIVQSQLEELHKTFCNFRLSDQQRRRRSEEILAAIEEKSRTQSEVEDATAFLLSSDGAEIEGLEASLVDGGRYVGQAELALLLEDWAITASGPRPTTDPAAKVLTIRGNTAMADQVDALVRTGERSRSETSRIASALRAEAELHLSTDQEASRAGGPELLTANHPLVRAALRTPGHRHARYAALALSTPDVEPGHYLVLMATASWQGVRQGHELWTQAVSCSSARPAPAAVGDLVLARLASGELQNCPPGRQRDLLLAVEEAQGLLLDRLQHEENRRQQENNALLLTRRVSVREVSDRKQAQIQQRIETLRTRDQERMIPMFEAQLRNERQRSAAALAQIDTASDCRMSLEHVAVCEVRVSA